MLIKSSFQEDTQTVKTKPGSYEWWYFDAQSVEGYSIVVIFYDGNPFSRRYSKLLRKDENALAGNFPAISISVYKDKKPIYYAFEEFNTENASFSALEPYGLAGSSEFSGKKSGHSIRYTLNLDHTLINGDSLKGQLIFDSVTSDMNQFGSKETGVYSSKNHEWNLVIPKCKVSGKLELNGYYTDWINFDGTGYHDHNFGEEPMRKSFDQWYWGRYHTKDSTFIYYLMEGEKGWNEQAWFFDDNGQIRNVTMDINKEDEELSIFGLKCSRKIGFKSDEEEVFLQKNSIIDSGPFYIRFLGKLIIKKGDKIEVAEGISEYIYPSRIENRLFWPLVNMRIRYPDSIHWVQKSPVLYRWTW